MTTKEEFTEQQWDALCYVRKWGDAKGWYAVLRGVGYTSGRHQFKKEIERLVDQWLAAHPSWRGRYVSEDEIEKVMRG